MRFTIKIGNFAVKTRRLRPGCGVPGSPAAQDANFCKSISVGGEQLAAALAAAPSQGGWEREGETPAEAAAQPTKKPNAPRASLEPDALHAARKAAMVAMARMSAGAYYSWFQMAPTLRAGTALFTSLCLHRRHRAQHDISAPLCSHRRHRFNTICSHRSVHNRVGALTTAKVGGALCARSVLGEVARGWASDRTRPTPQSQSESASGDLGEAAWVKAHCERAANAFLQSTALRMALAFKPHCSHRRRNAQR